MALSYCAAVRQGADPWNTHYHDHEYGFPIATESELFERLILEINQAGLSWLTILKKREGFRRAYDNFDIAKVADYTEEDCQRLLADSGIIRNRLKVNAAIENARRIQAIGSFREFLDAHHPLDRAGWTRLFKKTFVFTGGEIVNEFLLSTGYLPGAHDPDCPVYQRIIDSTPEPRRLR